MSDEGNRSVKEFYDNNPEFVTSPFTYNGEFNVRGKQLFENIPLADATVLDVGCGFGHVANYCAERGAECYGIDISENAIETARRQYDGIDFRVGDIENLRDGDLDGNRFDVIVMFEVLEHTSDWRKTLDVIHDRVKKGGWLLLSTPNYFNVSGITKLLIEQTTEVEDWSPFIEWSEQEREAFLTYFHVRRELANKFEIVDMWTLDILRGVCPFAYLDRRLAESRPVSTVRRLLERGNSIPLVKYLGSNLVVRAWAQ